MYILHQLIFILNHGYSICVFKVGKIKGFFCNAEKWFLVCASEVLVRAMTNDALDFFM